MLLLLNAAFAGDLLPRILPVPPTEATVVNAVPTAGRPAPRLKRLSATANQITDEEAWFTSNGLSLPLVAEPPAWVLPTVTGLPRVRVIDQGGVLLGLYGAGYDPSTVVVWGPNGEVRAAFDLSAWLTPARAKPGDEGFVHAGVRWAWVVEDVLYVTTAHRTYAASSYGKNAWITAIDLNSGALRWQSGPLVCNAAEFVVIGDSVVCGYGFTAEPDSLVILDRATGTLVERSTLKSGPEHFVVRGDRLYVRTYNTDYVYAIGQ